MSSIAFSYAALAFSGAFGLFLLISQYRSFTPTRQVPTMVALLGFGIITTTATLGVLRYGFSDRWVSAHDMFANLGWYMAMPLVGAALVSASRDLDWKRTTWWRILLGLCVAFEFARMMDSLVEYRLAVNLAAAMASSIAICLPGKVTSGSRYFTLAGILSCVIAVLAIGTEGQLAGYLRIDVFRYMTALGTLCLGSGLFLVLRRR